MAGSQRAVFLDRDGTLGGDGDHCHPDDFELYPCAAEAIAMINAAGWLAIVFTMQTGIGRGRWSEQQFKQRMARHDEELAAAGAHLDAWYWCTHEWGSGCPCGKPGPGMLEQAAADHGIDLAACWVVGDNGAADMAAGRAAGCRLALVRTGWGETSLGKYRETWAAIEPDLIADDVLAAVRAILGS